ncbi:dnaJ homolog subfamily B member 13-like [Sycon ciliatum]|uniref:dnaJ homolog subfamily B member 13-like n=1 Tax=Sycon ciliatum TaxID=27933 RepID=UPI0020AEC975|eukprot:scpid74151/ scgid6582/ DnaJ homolog subfamily B member 13; Testis and spermatogenesis cell-related protein 6; Testis spermatocyte apoptosis-related gene 6 protein; Testis spermatogenesis apoptosis-related gene 3 protein; Testis spermatogenesis apoptosis-related gene 6 protein
MGRNFYMTLDVDRDASLADIKKAYRLLALKHHPSKSSTEDSAKIFLDIAQAYDVLSNEKHRAIYDQFGEEGLILGVPMDEEGGFSGGYNFHGNADQVFREFFGGDNPFAEMFDFGITGDLRGAPEFGGLMGRARPKQAPDQLQDLRVSLEEVYRGCTKKLKITRQVMNNDRRTAMVKTKVLTVNVPPGATEGMKFRYRKEGDQSVNNLPADLVFQLNSYKHERFVRSGHNLLYEHHVQLWEALCGVWLEIQTLDSRFITVAINDIIRPGYTKVVKGEGLPRHDCPGETGDMIISFVVEFPRRLTSTQKESIRMTLGSTA